MARIRILMALAVAAVALGLVATTATASPETYMLRKINKFRRHHHHHGLHMARSLERSARRYARYQMRHQYFGHARRIHASSRYHRLGEILEIQRGYKAHVKRAFRAWIHSSVHRSIILDGEFDVAGVGRAKGRFHGRRVTIWVMHFGHP